MPYDILQQSILTTVTIPGEEAHHNHATTSNKSEQQHYRYSRKRRGEKEKVACSDQQICGGYARIEPIAQRFRQIDLPLSPPPLHPLKLRSAGIPPFFSYCTVSL